MPRKLRPNDTVLGWRILHEIHVGPLAMSYAALSPSGSKAFLKLYKSPTRTVPWYRGFMEHQVRLNQRIEAGPARAFTVRRLDGFEASFGTAAVAYFQAFEFVEGGEDLESVTAQIRAGSKAVNWNQRVLMAKVLMAGVHALHRSGVVHGDLKPANVQVFRDSSITAGYRLKLIDLDYAVMPDMLAPWHGQQGYVGTPGYYSPEHLIGRPPVPASDVFTCGIMLHELLTDQGNPYRLLTDEDYRRATSEWKAPKPQLAGRINGTTVADVTAIIHLCLNPDPEKRPTAEQVLAVLNGTHKPAAARSRAAVVPSPTPVVVPIPKGVPRSRRTVAAPTDNPARAARTKSRTATTPPPNPAPAMATTAAAIPPTRIVEPRAVVAPGPAITPAAIPGGSSSAGVLILSNASDPGRRLGFRLRTAVGRRLLETITEPAKVAHEVQYWIQPRSDGHWWLVPERDTLNQTLLNGKAVREETRLRPGDRLAVGNEERGVERQAVIVELQPDSQGESAQ
jgi:serine/threonine protein kinase